MFEVKALSVRIGDFRLQEIHLRLSHGECHAVLGPSGSGKSTLLKAILGAVPITAGHIYLAGEEITSWPMERRNLGYVPQHLGLFPHLSVRDNLCYSARARKLARDAFQPLLDTLIDITGIGDLLQRPINTLSGGERQRVALVRALAANPRLVLLDEPFTALDENLRRELWLMLKGLQRERGLTVLLVTHDLTESYFLAEKITILINGRQEQSGTKETVYRRPKTLAVARFLNIKNLFPGTVVDVSEQHITVDCPQLKHRFQLPGQSHVGATVILGIRAEDIMLCDAYHPPRPDDCLLEGTCQLIDMGTNVVMHFYLPQVPNVIEIVATRRRVNRLNIKNGQNHITIALPPSAMFWIPQ